MGCCGASPLAARIHKSHDLADPDVVGQKAFQPGYGGQPLARCLTLLLRQPCAGKVPEASTGFKALQCLGWGLHPREDGSAAARALLEGQPAPLPVVPAQAAP